MVIPYKDTHDRELVRFAQDGDSRAFDELVRRYQQKVYRLSYRILRHEEDAAEALQDTFLSAFRGLRNFKSESTFSTWLYRIATNASLMKYRKRRPNHLSFEQSQSSTHEGETLDLPDWSKQPLQEVLDGEAREVMEDGFRKLPEELRTVFVLRDLEELSNAEVAEILGVTIAAVKSRLHRARIFLRDWMHCYFAGKPYRKNLKFA